MSNLDRLNDLRRTAKSLGMTGYGRMKTTDLAAAVEAEQAKQDIEKSAANEAAIDRLRAEHPTATPERQEAIGYELARLGAVLYPQGTEAHEAYRANLKRALAEPGAWDFLDAPAAHRAPLDVVATPDTEIDLADAIDADDRDAIHAIGSGTPDVVVTAPKYETDPNATRYEDVERWTDDRLYSKEEELARRLTRRTLLGGDRKLTENRLSRIRKVIESRGL